MATNGQTDVCLVPNPIDTGFFSPSMDRRRNEIFRIGFFYSPALSKGTDLIIAAIREVLKEEPNVLVVSFGFDPPVRALPLPEQVEYFASPSQAQLPNIYSSCDAWIFGSRSEGYGLPIIEAMACGTPVIATPSGAAPDLVPVGGGILLSSTSSKEILEGIRLLMSETAERWKSRSDAAILEARKHSIKAATDALLSFILQPANHG
jgi:glycosyltransferase involved in cell wall biosynthesis